MNNAQHPLYFGSKASATSRKIPGIHDNARAVFELAVFEKFALKIGCHEMNKKVFFLEHSFCDVVRNQMIAGGL